MNESEFRTLWRSEKKIYDAWGRHVLETITDALRSKVENINNFLKIPAIHRLKDEKSLVDKAFYRPEKSYSNPYVEIEDKVGVRFVVLLLEDIRTVMQIIESTHAWIHETARNFEEEKKKSPLLFTYQSVHYIVRPKNDVSAHGEIIPAGLPCEVQIRTLLQHAHAELTHDAIYKSKRTVEPTVHRTVAKSMALIETTDEFFETVTNKLNSGPLQEHHILERLDSLYLSFIEMTPHSQKSALTIWDEFEDLINNELVENIQKFIVDDNAFLKNIIQHKYSDNIFYQQSTVFFVYWMLKKKKQRLLSDWPLAREILEPLAVDLGVSIID